MLVLVQKALCQAVAAAAHRTHAHTHTLALHCGTRFGWVVFAGIHPELREVTAVSVHVFFVFVCNLGRVACVCMLCETLITLLSISA